MTLPPQDQRTGKEVDGVRAELNRAGSQRASCERRVEGIVSESGISTPWSGLRDNGLWLRPRQLGNKVNTLRPHIQAQTEDGTGSSEA